MVTEVVKHLDFGEESEDIQDQLATQLQSLPNVINRVRVFDQFQNEIESNIRRGLHDTVCALCDFVETLDQMNPYKSVNYYVTLAMSQRASVHVTDGVLQAVCAVLRRHHADFTPSDLVPANRIWQIANSYRPAIQYSIDVLHETFHHDPDITRMIQEQLQIGTILV